MMKKLWMIVKSILLGGLIVAVGVAAMYAVPIILFFGLVALCCGLAYGFLNDPSEDSK